ncbi:hypothetical protein QWI17_22390 [Gilvimarinus sp. SDUM040013]|uniref:TonB C-terminal domain-containing protein n=1 Tax=Gilvimarinus gilvus TaxID=3058038 RepID=A0ABU4RWG1_9GAMM|nr:hypothetical protein [Gilvimarinus sp. SDUM040013]MDO3388612.1 hypothetical protein [Gilvimarinus sp. SDUM040013]MDX6848516.1 hypothetical protein [Gilvimarinus sp. SDUM040013]
MSASPQNFSFTFSRRELIPLLLAFLAAVALTFFTLGVIFYDGNPEPKSSSQKLRKISFAPTPPPPPPPVENTPIEDQVQQTLSSNLTNMTASTSVAFSQKPNILNTTLNEIPELNLNDYQLDFSGELEGSLQAYDVEELDERPKILSSRKSMIPSELTKKGINFVEAQVDILIDRYGDVHIKRIVDPGYNEMVPVIRSHIDALKFSTPLKNGAPVNAEYLFIIRFRVFK